MYKNVYVDTCGGYESKYTVASTVVVRTIGVLGVAVGSEKSGGGGPSPDPVQKKSSSRGVRACWSGETNKYTRKKNKIWTLLSARINF